MDVWVAAQGSVKQQSFVLSLMYPGNCPLMDMRFAILRSVVRQEPAP